MNHNMDWLMDASDAPEWLAVDKGELFTGIVAFGLAFVALIALWAVLS